MDGPAGFNVQRENLISKSEKMRFSVRMTLTDDEQKFAELLAKDVEGDSSLESF